jgi:uncharacterized protein
LIVADTSALVALVDADDRHHAPVRDLFESDPGAWVIPWAVLPELDYLLGAQVGPKAQDALLDDLAHGAFAIEWGRAGDMVRANALHTKYRALRLGLVDGVVIAIAERLRAHAIATLDLRHFGTVAIRGRPKLFPRDA